MPSLRPSLKAIYLSIHLYNVYLSINLYDVYNVYVCVYMNVDLSSIYAPRRRALTHSHITPNTHTHTHAYDYLISLRQNL
jgi:hypothetical protein